MLKHVLHETLLPLLAPCSSGTSHDSTPTPIPLSPEAGKGHLQAPGSEPPNSKAFYPVFHSFRKAKSLAVCGRPSESKHLSSAPFPGVLHNLPAALASSVSLSGKENVSLPPLPLPLLKFRLKLIFRCCRARCGLSPRVRPGLSPSCGQQPALRQTSAAFQCVAKATPLCCVGASERHGICKFGLSLTKSICLIRFM